MVAVEVTDITGWSLTAAEAEQMKRFLQTRVRIQDVNKLVNEPTKTFTV